MIGIGHPQSHFECPDVTLGPTHVALRGKAAIHGAIKDDPLAHLAGRQRDGQVVAETHAIDVGLLYVHADPQVVRIDQRGDRLTGGHHFPLTRGSHVDDPGDGRANLRVAKTDRGLIALRDSRR